MRLERLARLLKSLGFVDCVECKGHGFLFLPDEECSTCEGSGVVRHPSEASVSLHDDFRPEAP